MTDIIAKTLSHVPVDTVYIASRWAPARLPLKAAATKGRAILWPDQQ